MKTVGRTLLAGKNLMVVLTGLALAMLIATLVGKNYLAQLELRDSVLKIFKQDLEKQAAVLSYFYSERINDLNNLPFKREISIFFENKALGMSMQYGLKASLLAIQESLNLALTERTLNGEQIYTRYVFMDATGECLIDTQRTSDSNSPRNYWNRFLTPTSTNPVLLVEPQKDLASLIVSCPYFFKGTYSGQIVAWISSEIALNNFIADHAMFPQEVLGVFAKHEDLYWPLSKPNSAIRAILPHISTIRDSEWSPLDITEPGGSAVQLLSTKVPIQGTPLFLLGALSSNQLFGRMSPWHLLAALGSLSILSLLGVGFVWRAHNRNLILRTRLEEAALREEEVASKNRQLEEEIGERRRAEEALGEEAIRRRVLVEQSRDGIMVLDQNGKVYEANQRYAEMLGYSLEEVRQLHVWDWDVQWRKAELRELVQAVDARGDYFETRHRRKDGTLLEVEISTNGVVLGGEKLIFCVCRDISQRKAAERALRASEEKYRLVFENAPLGIFHYDQTGTITDCNAKLAEIISTTKEGFIGFNLIRQLKDEKMRKAVAASLRGEVGHYEGDYLSVGALKLTPVRVIFQPISSGEGVFLGGVTLVEDMSARKQAEEERLRFSKIESLGTLAGGIAHDFNNILMAMLGNISLAQMDLQNEKATRKRLQAAEDACQKAQGLARQLLTFARGGEPVKELVGVKNLVTETGTFSCRGLNVLITFNFPDDLWPVEADPGQISQVIQNLAINAQQAMPSGGTITVKGENLELTDGSDLPLKQGKYVKISMHDQGVGIPGQHLDKIFDPYFTTKQTGSGLGLATVYSIVKNHQGHTAVESTLGAGSTFHIYLPAVRRKIKEPSLENGKVVTGRGRILVMDDEKMVRETLGRMLGRLGYESDLAKDGAEVLKLFILARESGGTYDAVLLDLTVPGGMGGKETLEQLLQIDPQIRAIVSSGYSQDAVMAEFGQYGFRGVIAKPYRIWELSRALAGVLKQHRETA